MRKYCSFKKILIFPAIVLALVVYSMYIPAFKSGFVNWDDDVHLLQNPFIRHLSQKSLVDIFTTTVNTTYIPLTQVSFALEYHFFQEQAFVYHWTNTVLHVLISVMVMFLALRLGLRFPGAFLAGLIFGVHPIHVESVAWVTERKDVLYSFFYMIALLAYCKYSQSLGENRKFPAYLLGGVYLAGLLSILAKPMAVSLPFVLCVFDWYFKRPVSLLLVLEKFLLGFLLLPVALITYLQQPHVFSWHFPQSLIAAIWHYTFYLRGFFYPNEFFLFYKPPLNFSFADQQCFIAGIILSLLLTVFLVRKWRILRFAVFYYTASIFFLIPFQHVDRLGYVSDRFMYLASVGFCAVIGYFTQYFWDNRKMVFRFCVGVVAVLGIAFLAGKTMTQIQVWESSISLWEHQLKSERMMLPVLVYDKLGQAYFARFSSLKQSSAGALEDFSKSAMFFKKAIVINPSYSRAYRNLGALCLEAGDFFCAEVNLTKALSLDQSDFEIYFQRGRLLIMQGKVSEASHAFGEALRRNPDNLSLRERIENVMMGQISNAHIDTPMF